MAQKVFLSLSETKMKLWSLKAAAAKQTWSSSIQLAVSFHTGRREGEKKWKLYPQHENSKGKPWHFALEHSHSRFSPKSHLEPLDVIHGLPAEAIVCLVLFFPSSCYASCHKEWKPCHHFTSSFNMMVPQEYIWPNAYGSRHTPNSPRVRLELVCL